MQMIRVGTIRRVPVNVHWSLVAGVVVCVAASIERLLAALFLVALYVLSFLLHEWGHVMAARSRGCEVLGIDLYLVLGRTRFQAPATRFDHCVIAWGGVVLQAIVGFPMVVWIKLVGYTSFGLLDATLAVVGFLAVVMVPFNLLPIRGLDGALAWQIVPMLWERARKSQTKRTQPKPVKPESVRWRRWG
jgi:membrane-associated protease RseP (regulator of RpoE activity)